MMYLKSLLMLIGAILQQPIALPFIGSFLFQFAFLFFTVKRPACWKWIVLLVTEIISLISAVFLLLEAHHQDDLGYLYLSIICICIFTLILFISSMLFLLQKQQK